MKLVVVGFLLSLTVLAFAPTVAMAQSSTTFRNASGQQTGSASTSRNGTTTYRDASGRQIGTSTRR
jgi:hypothetical protein